MLKQFAMLKAHFCDILLLFGTILNQPPAKHCVYVSLCLYLYTLLCVARSFLVRFSFVADELKHFPGTIAMDRFAGQLWWCSMDTQVKIGGDEEELEEDIFEEEEDGDEEDAHSGEDWM